MNTTTHTLSPWNIQSGKVYGGGMLVATLDPPQLQEEVAMKAADAHLIAAAPELLDALVEVYKWGQRSEHEKQQSGPVLKDYLRQAAEVAREAIAKATGGAE